MTAGNPNPLVLADGSGAGDVQHRADLREGLALRCHGHQGVNPINRPESCHTASLCFLLMADGPHFPVPTEWLRSGSGNPSRSKMQRVPLLWNRMIWGE
jgi:hypothetical protein